jgi:hypothetical protein
MTSAGQNKEESPEIYCRYYIKKLQVNLEKCKKTFEVNKRTLCSTT